MLNKKVMILYSIILLFLIYIVVMYMVIGASHTGLVKGKMKLEGFQYDTWKMFFYPHIILGMIALAIGPFQFTKMGHRKNKVHKQLGKIYAAAIFINVLVVPYIALFSTGGLSSGIAFLCLDAFWLFTTIMGILRIYQKNILAHKRWIMRSYAVTWVFVTFRLFVGLFSIFMDPSLSFQIAVYLSIMINLLFVELLLKRKVNKVSKNSNVPI